MKKIIVDCCRNCHLVIYRGSCVAEEIPYCAHEATEGREIMDTDIIPKWCELEDE